MMMIGKIHAVVEKLVVVHALKDMKPLDLDSVLFLSYDQPLGRVFDVFGPIVEPFYSIRFNSADDISNKGVKVGADVFFAPDKNDITSYVFVDELQNQKGSDASWKHNNEPPEEFLDFSDDESEKAGKRKHITKNRNHQFSTPKRTLLGFPSESNYIPPPPPSPQRHGLQTVSVGFSRPSPFATPQSPSPSMCSFVPSVRVQNSFNTSTPNQSCFQFSSPRRPSPHQNVLYGPSSPLSINPYQAAHVFGQLAVLGPLSPALQSPSLLNSPANFPGLLPPSQWSTVPHQNYFGQRFPRSPSPVSQNQRMSPDPWIPRPSPDPWLRNRPHNSLSVPPSHPLTVEIPRDIQRASIILDTFRADGSRILPFINSQYANNNQQFANSNINLPNGNMQPRF